MQVINLPIEPMENRYSKQWKEWFDKAFQRNKMQYVTVKGDPYPDYYGGNEFIQPSVTFRWKFQQLERAIGYITTTRMKTTTIVVFLHDGWFPGIEALAFLRDVEDFKIKICAFWHAGSYEPYDILTRNAAEDWAINSERSWFYLCDKVFVGSEYHRQRILAALGSRGQDCNKVIVTGCPIEVPQINWANKRDRIVVWPHRISDDKNPDEFDRLKSEVLNDAEFQDVAFIKTMEVCKDKKSYYDLLANSRVAVSTADHETFGISMVEASYLGCYPVCPRRLSYPEIIPDEHLYTYFPRMLELVKHGLHSTYGWSYPHHYKDRFSQEVVTNRICMHLKEVGER